MTATILDWSLCIDNILELAEESAVRRQFVTTLQRVLRKSENRRLPGPPYSC